MTVANSTEPPILADAPRTRSLGTMIGRLEVDLRVMGMVAAVAVLWLVFNMLSDGKFLTPRNLWNLSVQSAAVAIMCFGLVMLIVSSNIDLSIGWLLVF